MPSSLDGIGPPERGLAGLQHFDANCLYAARNRLQNAASRDASDTTMPFQKKACGSGVVTVWHDKTAERRWHTVFIDAVWSRNFERGEIVSPGGSIASKL